MAIIDIWTETGSRRSGRQGARRVETRNADGEERDCVRAPRPARVALIYTARDARAPGRQVSAFTPAPAAFDGDLETFAAEYVVPNLPSPEAVAAFHEALAEYVATPDALLILRTGAERGEIYRGLDGTRFKRSDNAPAWWVHAALVHGHRIAPGAFGAVVATMPTRMFEVLPASAPTASAAGWHTAHIFPLNNGDTNFSRWSRAELVGRFVRNIHPCNYFLLAKTDWAPWGKDPRVIAFFAALYRRRYHEVWEDFVALAHVADAIRHVDAPIAYRYRLDATAPAPARTRKSRSRSAGSARPTTGRRRAMPEYRASRLTFKRDIIEALRDDESFRVITPMGVFEMTKGDLYRTFPGVPRSASYLVSGRYNYSRLPAAAAQFLVSGEVDP